MDPRNDSIRERILRALPGAPAHERAAEILEILRGPRDVSSLRELAKILPRRAGLRYDAETMEKRARQRLEGAFKAARTHGKPPFLTILDVGCARAENARLLGDFGVRTYLGLDPDPGLFPAADGFAMECRFLEASADSIPLPDASVDLAISFNVFEHLAEPAQALREIVRVLRPGGVFHTKFGPPFNAPTGPHLTRYVDLPYLHHLYDEQIVAGFVGRDDAYRTVNRRPLADYRNLFFSGTGFSLPHYREQIDERGLWLVRELPELRSAFELDELGVCAVTATVVRDGPKAAASKEGR